MYVYASASLKGCVAQSRVAPRRAAPPIRIPLFSSSLLCSRRPLAAQSTAEQKQKQKQKQKHSTLDWIGLHSFALADCLCSCCAIPFSFSFSFCYAFRLVSIASLRHFLVACDATRLYTTPSLLAPAPRHPISSHHSPSPHRSRALPRSHPIPSDPIRSASFAPLRSASS